MLSTHLLVSALVSGLPLGVFYAAIASGLALVFGVLDIPNLAHPAVVVAAALFVHTLNTWGIDPLLAGLILAPFFFVAGALFYRFYRFAFERGGTPDPLRSFSLFFGLAFLIEVALIFLYGIDFQSVQASYIGRALAIGWVRIPYRMLASLICGTLILGTLHLFLTRSMTGRAIRAAGYDQDALPMLGISPRAHPPARLWPLAGHRRHRRSAADRHRAGDALGRSHLHRAGLRGRGARRHGVHLGHLPGRHHSRPYREHRADDVRGVVGYGGVLRPRPPDPCRPPRRPVRTCPMTRSFMFWIGCLALLLAAYALTVGLSNEYAFFAGYVVLQFVLLATAWNIAGGYAGYVNFGTAGFFGAGAYAAVAASRAFDAPLGIQIACAAAVGALIGLGVGYLSVRLRGIYYSIATIAVAVILEAVVLNWPLVGDARGLSITRPPTPAGFANYTSFLFVVMAALAIMAVAIARTLERSKLGPRLRCDPRQRARRGGVAAFQRCS